jgi:hypothetical protein
MITKGGVTTWVNKIMQALRIEGINYSVSLINNFSLLSLYLQDLLRSIQQDNSLVMYFGSIPSIGHLIDKLKGAYTITFISGHPICELLNVIKGGSYSLRTKIGASVLLSYLKIFLKTRTMNMWVCHTLTACEEIGVDNFVLLKQFVLPSEIEIYSQLREKYNEECGRYNKNNQVVTIFAYMSYADLPFLNIQHLRKIFNTIRKRVVSKPIRFIVEDPRIKQPVKLDSGFEVIGRMSKHKFYRTLASSDLFIEVTLDEELRLTSLDAGLLGVPISKITLSNFRDRRDFDESIIIDAPSVEQFIDNVVEYIKNIDYYKPEYSKKVREFIISKRSWEAVKHPFIDVIKSCV